jgi:hypothetical protein
MWSDQVGRRAIVVLRGKKDDPDEQRWRREAAERKRLEDAAQDRPD